MTLILSMHQVGHSDAAAAFADDDLEDFEEFLAGVLMV